MPAPAPKARCPDPLHRRAAIKGWGTFARKSGKYRLYRCEPLVGKTHYFSVPISGGTRVRGHAGAPSCGEHPGSLITRNGTSRRGSTQPRQVYKCHHERCTAMCRQACVRDHGGRPHGRSCPKACVGTHTFSPALPRAHVHFGESCAECLELKGLHRGEMAAARRHRAWARLVVRILSELSLGLSYAKAGRLALDIAKIPVAPLQVEHRRDASPRK